MQLANAFADLLLNADVSRRESETKTNIETKKENTCIAGDTRHKPKQQQWCTLYPVPTVYISPTQRLL